MSRFECYPAARLPEELRGEIPESATVRVIIDEQTRPASRAELIALTHSLHANRRGTAIEKAVDRTRTLRDEWED
jgi:hypothetical protein